MKRQSSADRILSMANQRLQKSKVVTERKESAAEDDINAYLSTLRKQTIADDAVKKGSQKNKFFLDLQNLTDPDSDTENTFKKPKEASKFLKKKKPSDETVVHKETFSGGVKKSRSPSPRASVATRVSGPNTSLAINKAVNLIKKHDTEAVSKSTKKKSSSKKMVISDSEFEFSIGTSTPSSSARKEKKTKEGTKQPPSRGSTPLSGRPHSSSGSSKPSTPEVLYHTSTKAKLNYLTDEESQSLGKGGARFLKKKVPPPDSAPMKHEEVTTPKTPDRIRFADEHHGGTKKSNRFDSRHRYGSSDEDDLNTADLIDGLTSSSGVTPRKPTLRTPRTPPSPKKQTVDDVSIILSEPFEFNDRVTIDESVNRSSMEEDLTLDDMMVIKQNFDDDDDEISLDKERIRESDLEQDSSISEAIPGMRKVLQISDIESSSSSKPIKLETLGDSFGVLQFADDLSESNEVPKQFTFSKESLRSETKKTATKEAKSQGRGDVVSSESESSIAENLGPDKSRIRVDGPAPLTSQYSSDFESSIKEKAEESIIQSVSDENSDVDASTSSSSTKSSVSKSTATFTESQSRSVEHSGRRIKVKSTKSIKIQTTDPGLAFLWNPLAAGQAHLDPAFGLNYVDPTPIAHYAVSPDALEAVTAYSPCTIVLNDLIRQQLTMTQNFMTQQKMLYQAMLSTIHTGYRYTTLEDTKEFIRRNRPKKMTFKEALKEVEREMNSV